MAMESEKRVLRIVGTPVVSGSNVAVADEWPANFSVADRAIGRAFR
jgi:hypothetical protein